MKWLPEEEFKADQPSGVAIVTYTYKANLAYLKLKFEDATKYHIFV